MNQYDSLEIPSLKQGEMAFFSKEGKVIRDKDQSLSQGFDS